MKWTWKSTVLKFFETSMKKSRAGSSVLHTKRGV